MNDTWNAPTELPDGTPGWGSPTPPSQPPKPPLWRRPWVIITGCVLVGFTMLGILGSTDDIQQPQPTVTAPDTTPVTKATTGAVAAPETTDAPATTTKAVVAKWRTIHTLQGSGPKKGPDFKITSDQARVKYSYSGGGQAGLFSFYVVPEGVNIMEEGGFPEVMESQGSGADTTELAVGPGTFYLQANTANVTWKLEVQEYR